MTKEEFQKKCDSLVDEASGEKFHCMHVGLFHGDHGSTTTLQTNMPKELLVQVLAEILRNADQLEEEAAERLQ